jgi:hypothetical protein
MRCMALMQEAGRKIGLILNLSKCELMSSVPIPPEFRHGVGQLLPMSEMVLLGSPVGCAAFRDEFAGKVALKTIRKVSMIARLGELNAHSAFAALRLCGASALMGHILRSVGRFSAMGAVDDASMAAFSAITVAGNASTRAQVSLPIRLGGFGIRLLARYADIAFFSSILASSGALGKVFFVPDSLPADPALAAAGHHIVTAHPSLTESISELQRDGAALPINPVQKTLSRAVDAQLATDLRDEAIASNDDNKAARLTSLRHAWAGCWLAAYTEEASPWFSDREFRIACAFRLGLPIAPADSLCPFCSERVSDMFGHHSLACSRVKWAVHNPLRDTLAKWCSFALLHACRETKPFADTGPAHADKRIDIQCNNWPTGVTMLLDVAVVSPFVNLSAAIDSTGGAATLYQMRKHLTYDAAVDRSHQAFAPIIFDSFGAAGDEATHPLKVIAKECTKRLTEASGDGHHAKSLFFVALSGCIARQISRLLLSGSSGNHASCPAPCEVTSAELATQVTVPPLRLTQVHLGALDTSFGSARSHSVCSFVSAVEGLSPLASPRSAL